MATLVFGALGTALGGPVGGALGSLLGRELDRRIIGSPARQGPRLKELTVSTSSYGQPIARHFGAMRVAGTVIWATDLRETTTTGGGKGAPDTTSYSYAISMAVALSSRPIERVGRIWADGNLLRGAAGDLKTGGTLRLYTGRPDQPRDPLLSAALGAECPAHRGMAYAVFEDLQLGDFGNRIPALGFEIFADGAGAALACTLLKDVGGAVAQPVPVARSLAGFSHEGGSLADALAMLGEAVPMTLDGLRLGPTGDGADPVTLPAFIAWPDGEFGARTGASRSRAVAQGARALRYYDIARDYQPGLQRAPGRAPTTGEAALELPASLSAQDARGLIAAIARRDRIGGERMSVRVAAIDPAMRPGASVVVPGATGLWTVQSREWREGGVELDLVRQPAGSPAPTLGADPGTPWSPPDRKAGATRIEAFELPWDGTGSPDTARIMVAIGSDGGRWPGAELFVERGGALVPLGASGPARCVMGSLSAPLASSPALVFEPGATLDVSLDNTADVLPSSDLAGIASGANRMLVGSEIVQFAAAVPLGAGRWRLTGLLRGRGGTEAEAMADHGAGTRAILLDRRLRVFGAGDIEPATERFAAIGLAESAPAFAEVRDAGRSRRPLPPVRPRAEMLAGGALSLSWVRRARGAWRWSEFDPPLIEEAERYEVIAGGAAAPLRLWPASEPNLIVPGADLADLPAGTVLSVRQCGTFARSHAVPLFTLP